VEAARGVVGDDQRAGCDPEQLAQGPLEGGRLADVLEEADGDDQVEGPRGEGQPAHEADPDAGDRPLRPGGEILAEPPEPLQRAVGGDDRPVRRRLDEGQEAPVAAGHVEAGPRRREPGQEPGDDPQLAPVDDPLVDAPVAAAQVVGAVLGAVGHAAR